MTVSSDYRIMAYLQARMNWAFLNGRFVECDQWRAAYQHAKTMAGWDIRTHYLAQDGTPTLRPRSLDSTYTAPDGAVCERFR
jgi:hypothetical protein